MQDPASSALLTIDVQVDVCDPGGGLFVEGTAECLPAMARVVDAYRHRGLPIIHVVRLYLADGSNAEPLRRQMVTETPVLRPGTPGCEIAPELLAEPSELDTGSLLAGERQRLGPSEWVMYKPRWGAFYGTPLVGHLRGLHVGGVVVVGANFANCPRTTLYEASERDLKIAMVTDAVSGTYERGLGELTGIGAGLWDSGELVDLLGSPGDSGEATAVAP